MASNNNIIRRLEAIEAAIAPTQRPVLVNVWTKSLANRIEKVLPKDRDIRLLHLSFADEKAEQKKSIIAVRPATTGFEFQTSTAVELHVILQIT